MTELRYTLLSDGSSDRVLLYVLQWLLHQLVPQVALAPQWADFRMLPKPPWSLADRLRVCSDLYPCDLLFVHRDAEGETREVRVQEIRHAVREVAWPVAPPPCCVIPVRMQEAWFLFNEAERAIRRAAANPNGTVPLEFPPDPEALPNPKKYLHNLLRSATGLPERRRRKFNVGTTVHRLAELIRDYSPLRQLSAFCSMEQDLIGVLGQLQLR